MTSKRIRPWWSDSTETASGISGAIKIAARSSVRQPNHQNRILGPLGVLMRYAPGRLIAHCVFGRRQRVSSVEDHHASEARWSGDFATIDLARKRW